MGPDVLKRSDSSVMQGFLNTSASSDPPHAGTILAQVPFATSNSLLAYPTHFSVSFLVKSVLN